MALIFINGKFVAQRVTGVQRLALGMVVALDNILSKSYLDHHWVLLCPPGVSIPKLNNIEVRIIGLKSCGLHIWEQLFLPAYTFGRPLLNLAGPAPLLKVDQVCMIPDAAVFDFPQAYTFAYRIWYKSLFRTVIRTSKIVLTISEFSKRRLLLALGSNAKRLQVISCGANHFDGILPDLGVLDRLGLKDVKYMLAVASNNPSKNILALVSAFHMVESSDVRLVLVGGSNNSVFMGESLTTSDDTRIIIAGSISDSELHALYCHAYAFIFPSLYEGFGMPPLEAMSVGCPVLASSNSSIPEVCGDAALYFDPKNIRDMTRAIEDIMTDRGLRENLILRGKLRVKKFTWDHSAQELLNHLIVSNLLD